MSKKTTKLIFKNTAKVLKTFGKPVKGIDVDDIQMYITTTEGTICEIHLSVDGDGKMHKTFNVHDSADEMQEAHEEMGFEPFHAEVKPLLN